MGKRREPDSHKHGGKGLSDKEVEKLNKENDDEFERLLKKAIEESDKDK
jgi:hypothetical protein